MSWAKENKFLTGLIAVVVVGTGALGYLIYTAMSKADEANTAFESQAGELRRLQSLAVFPNDENLKKLQDQKSEYQSRVESLQKSLRAMELPEQPLTPEQFQDKLKATVTAYVAKANEAHVTLPKEKFFLGFERYQANLPKPEAAPVLGRELSALEWVMERLVDHHVNEITSVKPEEVPEERGDKQETKPRNAQGPGGPGAPGGPGGRQRQNREANPIRRTPFTISFVSDQSAFRAILNDIVTNKSQLYVTRVVEVKSTLDKPPTREVAPASVETAPPPAPEPAANPATPTAPGAQPVAPPLPTATPAAPAPGEGVTKFVVGEEKVAVNMMIEIIDFVPPADEGKGGKDNKKNKENKAAKGNG